MGRPISPSFLAQPFAERAPITAAQKRAVQARWAKPGARERQAEQTRQQHIHARLHGTRRIMRSRTTGENEKSKP